MQVAEDAAAVVNVNGAVDAAVSRDTWGEMWGAHPDYVPFGTYIFIKDERPNKCVSRENIANQLKDHRAARHKSVWQFARGTQESRQVLTDWLYEARATVPLHRTSRS